MHRTGGPTLRWPDKPTFQGAGGERPGGGLASTPRTFALVISLEAKRMTALAMSLSSSLMWLLTTVSMALRIIVRYGCAS